MSTPSKIILGMSFAFTGAIVFYVHYKQQLDREQMHEGVIKDIERQQRRKIENLYMIEKQNEFRKSLENNLRDNS